MLQLVLLTSQQHQLCLRSHRISKHNGNSRGEAVGSGTGVGVDGRGSRTVLCFVGDAFHTPPLCSVLSQVRPGKEGRQEGPAPGTSSGHKPPVGRDSPFGVTFSDRPGIREAPGISYTHSDICINPLVSGKLIFPSSLENCAVWPQIFSKSQQTGS